VDMFWFWTEAHKMFTGSFSNHTG